MSHTEHRTTLTGIVYTERGGRRLALDLHLPTPSAAPTPVLVYLHGGAWITGSRDETPTRLQNLAQAGIAVASIDYTFVQEAPFPAQLQNIVDATSWLAENAERYGLDLARTVIGGASAGGHLALLSALTLSLGSGTASSAPSLNAPPSLPDLPALPAGVTITGMLSLFASTDLTSLKPMVDRARGLTVPAMIAEAPLPAFFEGTHPSPSRRAALLTGVPEGELTDDLLAGYSPLYRLHSAAPPSLLLHGTADAMVSADHSVRFHEAARAAGLVSDLVLVDGANHEGPEFDDAAVTDRIAGFVAGDEARFSGEAVAHA